MLFPETSLWPNVPLRGGQHPEWDEELRFTIMEDVDDVLTRSESQPDTSLSSSTSHSLKDGQPGVTTAAALASKSRKGPLIKKGVKSMRVACYADDAKEPELIGECVVTIEDVLKQGEVDGELAEDSIGTDASDFTQSGTSFCTRTSIVEKSTLNSPFTPM